MARPKLKPNIKGDCPAADLFLHCRVYHPTKGWRRISQRKLAQQGSPEQLIQRQLTLARKHKRALK